MRGEAGAGNIICFGKRGDGALKGLSAGRGLIGRPGLKRGVDKLLRCTVVEDIEESDPEGLSKEESAGTWASLGDGGRPCIDDDRPTDTAGSTICGRSFGVLLLLFDFLDTLRAASCTIAIASRILSSSSRVFRRPLSNAAASRETTVLIGDSVGETSTAGTGGGIRVGCARFSGAGAGFRAVCLFRGLKLPASGTGVASVSSKDGAAGGGSLCTSGVLGEAGSATVSGWPLVTTFGGVESCATSSTFRCSEEGVSDRSCTLSPRALDPRIGEDSMLVRSPFDSTRDAESLAEALNCTAFTSPLSCSGKDSGIVGGTLGVRLGKELPFEVFDGSSAPSVGAGD
jgi:hypothetical protein